MARYLNSKEGFRLLKSGIYGRYQGVEYEITVDMDGNIEIMTEDKGMIDDTFKDDYNDGLYTKKVMPHELKDCVSIDTYGFIQDEEVQVLQEKGSEYQVGTGDLLVGSKLKLPRIDRDAWLGWVSKDKVKIVEKKRPIDPEDL